MKFVYLTFLSLIIFSCNEEPSKSSTTNKQDEVKPKAITEDKNVVAYGMHEEYSRPSFKRKTYKSTNKITKDIKNYETNNSSVAAIYFGDSANYYLTSTYGFNFYDRDFDKMKSYSFGLIKDNGDVVLEKKYNCIYNPDATAVGFIEIEKNGKFGLYNYKTDRLLSPKYDVIFPSLNNEFIAIGKIGKSYFNIASTGEDFEIKNKEENPNYKVLLDKFNLDITSEYYQPYFEPNSEYDSQNLSAVLFTPSYLKHLNFLPPYFANISGDDDSGVIAAKASIEASNNVNENTTFLSSFFEEGLEARGYTIESKQILSTNANQDVVSSVEIMSDVNSNSEFGCNTFDFKFLNDTLIQVYRGYDYEEEIPFKLYKAQLMYKFYVIGKDGTVREFKPNRLFPMISAVELTPEYLKTCTANYLTEKEKEEMKPEYDDAPYLTERSHLTADDLRYMRNELYASYGYEFDNDSLTEIFNNYDWYKPRTKDVDKLLTPLEKANIKFVLEFEKKLKANEEKYTKPTRKMANFAG